MKEHHYQGARRWRSTSTRDPRDEGAPLPGSREVKEHLYQGAGRWRSSFIRELEACTFGDVILLKGNLHLLWADITNLWYIGIKKIGRGGKNQHSPHSVWIHSHSNALFADFTKSLELPSAWLRGYLSHWVTASSWLLLMHTSRHPMLQLVTKFYHFYPSSCPQSLPPPPELLSLQSCISAAETLLTGLCKSSLSWTQCSSCFSLQSFAIDLIKDKGGSSLEGPLLLSTCSLPALSGATVPGSLAFAPGVWLNSSIWDAPLHILTMI